VAKRRFVFRLVQQAPDDYARVVPVASDHADVAVIRQPGSVVRRRSAAAFLEDQEPDLVAQAELVTLTGAANSRQYHATPSLPGNVS
jgi:hypothetical protein